MRTSTEYTYTSDGVKCSVMSVEAPASGDVCAPMTVTNRWRYAGKEEQAFLIRSDKCALIDFGARLYDPWTARWTTPDPMAGKYTSMAPHNYYAGNPVMFVDPDGMKFTEQSSSYLQSYITEVNHRLEQANSRKAALMDEQTNASAKKSDRLQKKIDKINSEIGEYYQIAGEIQTLSRSDQVYNIMEVDNIPNAGDNTVIGGVMYNFDTNQFD